MTKRLIKEYFEVINMSLKDKLRKVLASAACITTFLGPTVNIENMPKEPASIEEIVEYSPSISFEMPKAEARDHKLEGRLTVLGFDVLFNGLKSGFGAMDNGDDFWPAFGKGALSGLVVYTGKEIASHNGEVPFTGAIGKLTHDFGVSMSDNVMRGEDIFSRFRTDFGPIEFDFNKGGVDLYFHPFSAGAIISGIVKGHDFDIKQTLFNLTPVFSYKGLIVISGAYYCGITQQNVITYSKGCDKGVLSHEMNHVLFFSEFRFLDDLMGKKSKAIEQIPIIRPLAPVFDYIKFGPSLAQGLMETPRSIDQDAYWYLPHELEAYTMERYDDDGFSKHPFYR
jgi:hypothetical protein